VSGRLVPLSEPRAQQVKQLKGTLIELRELARRGVISQDTLATWEARGEQEIIELSESSRPGATPVGNTSRKQRYIDAGCDETTATMLAEGRDPRTDPVLRERIEMLEAKQLAALYDVGITHGLSEAGAIAFAVGREPRSHARAKALIEKAKGAPLEGDEAALEDAFGQMGLTESKARSAARGR
jgi:hypothetical protein